MHNSSEAKDPRDEIVDKDYRIYPKAMNILDDNFIHTSRIMGLKNSPILSADFKPDRKA